MYRTGDCETAHGGRHFGLSDPVFAIVRCIRSVMHMLVVFSFVRAFVRTACRYGQGKNGLGGTHRVFL